MSSKFANNCLIVHVFLLICVNIFFQIVKCNFKNENVNQPCKQLCNCSWKIWARRKRVGGGKISIGPQSPFLPFYRFLYWGVDILLQIFPRGGPDRPQHSVLYLFGGGANCSSKYFFRWQKWKKYWGVLILLHIFPRGAPDRPYHLA